MFDIWTIPDESDLSEARDILLLNGMFQPGRSGTEKEYQDFERDEIELHNKNFAECIEIDQEDDPCGGRSCDECEIGGCDHEHNL